MPGKLELELFPWLVGGWSILAAAVFVVLLRVSAPYGRHARPGWGPTLPARLAWVVMELPAAAVPAVLFAAGDHRGPLSWLFLALWEVHYLYRALVFPFRIRGAGRNSPVSVVAMAVAFNLVNGYVNGRWLFNLGPERGLEWLGDPRMVVGLALFGGGMALHLTADSHLRRLRRPGEAGYSIPRGGPFEWVSCPNYLGEIVQWCGWALATWSLAGLSFALWTFANLAPRALSHHRWYKETFPDYPARRRALLPCFF